MNYIDFFMSIFSNISQIDPIKKETWQKNFLTFDMDWAHDEVMIDTFEILF